MLQVILKANTMTSIEYFGYYYVQSSDSIMRNNDIQKTRKKLQDKLFHFDNLILEIDKMDINENTKENVYVYLTNGLLANVKILDKENKKYYIKELKKRNIKKYIKVRSLKQLIKRIILQIKY